MAASRCTLLLLVLLSAAVTGCPPGGKGAGAPSPGATFQGLPGIDHSSLTAREQRLWQDAVFELLAPCPEVAVSVGQCVTEDRPCAACAPAARFLMQQVRAGRPEGQVLDLFEARFDPNRVRTLVVGDSASEGPTDALVTVVEFADFECPSCANMSVLLETLRKQYPDSLRLVFKHYPISYHRNAEVAARAAAAAQQQGKFWPMLRQLFDNQDRLTEPELRGHAAAVGLDLERFERDLNSPEVASQVSRESKQGKGLGVRGTPTLFINGREVPLRSLDDTLRELVDWIDLELEMAR